MKRNLIALLIALVVIQLCGDVVELCAEDDSQTFTSSVGKFEFRHSRSLIECPTTHEGTAGNKAAPESCTSQGELCGSETTTYVCYSYPKDRFKDKLSFSGAAFFVAEVADTNSESCTAGSSDWQVSTSDSRTINGITFKRFLISDAWTAHEKTGEIYRTHYKGKCYELGIGQVLTNPTVFDPSTTREFTKQDQAEVYRRLHQMVETFRFLP